MKLGVNIAGLKMDCPENLGNLKENVFCFVNFVAPYSPYRIVWLGREFLVSLHYIVFLKVPYRLRRVAGRAVFDIVLCARYFGRV